MTWRNIVTDNGSYDLDPTAGAVTIRVCSVRAAEVVGTRAAAAAVTRRGGRIRALALLLGLPPPLCGGKTK
jgi:hypothetical protein